MAHSGVHYIFERPRLPKVAGAG